MFIRKYKNDILLILVVLVLAGGVWLLTRLTRRQGGEAVVTVDGETVAVLPLAEDASLTVAPSRTDYVNTVVVADGRVCVETANCPDRICVEQGWKRYDGEMIVCLPHRLIVTVRGGAPGTDATVQ